MASLLDDSDDHHSVGSSHSFQVQLMRCGFLPTDSVSSFDLKDLSDLEFDDEANDKTEDHSDNDSDVTTNAHSRSISPKPRRVPPRGLRATLSFRLSRRRLFDDDETNDASLQESGRGSLRNQGLPRRVQRTKSATDKLSSMRRTKTA